jgi:Cu-Zn family superoxide dismutase
MRFVPLVIGVLLLSGTVASGQANSSMAKAELRNAQGEIVGFATLTESSDGVTVVAHVHGLPPGLHGLHIHAVGKCSPPDFQSAGSHFNPFDASHGLMDPQGAHAGDLPNLLVGPGGTGVAVTFAPLVTLASEKKNSLFHPGGTAFVIHEKPDDYRTDPSGEAQGRIACGVISRLDHTGK